MKIDSREPMNGAVENKAPVRAVPIFPNDTIKATRLMPIPKKPNTPACRRCTENPSRSPTINPINKFEKPAINPLVPAVNKGFKCEIFLVALLSIPQHSAGCSN